jgi:hypothetical protein
LIGIGKPSQRRLTPAAGRESSRTAFLYETCDLLWPPAPSGAALPATAGARSNLIVLPNLRRPRLVVAGDRRVAAAAVRRYGEPRSASSRWGVLALSLLMRSGVGGAVMRKRVSLQPWSGADTIETYLSEQLQQELRISMYLGAPRPNRKPVLHLFTPNGEPVGVAKIGVSPLARELVRAERDALNAIDRSRVPALRVPEVLRYGVWQDMPVMVLDALPTHDRRHPLTADHLAEAMAQVASLADTGDAALAESGWWAGLAPRLDDARRTRARESLISALGGLGSKVGDETLRFGAWHGDWTPWNMAPTVSGLLVWDWERFATGVPVGFDALHHALQSYLNDARPDPLAAARECVGDAPRLLAPFGIGAEAARLTAILYLAELAVRHLADDTERAGARLGSVDRWLIPALNAGVAEL